MAVEQAVNQATNTAKSFAGYAWSTFRTLMPLTTVFMGIGMMAGGGSSVLAALPSAKDVTLGTLGKVSLEGLTESAQWVGGTLASLGGPTLESA